MPTVLRLHDFPIILQAIERITELANTPPDIAAKIKETTIANQLLFFADARRTAWDAERRARFGEKVRERWTAAGAHTPLLRYEWQEDEPRTVSQEEAAAELGCTVNALKLRLKRNPNGVVLRLRDHLVFFTPSADDFTFLLHREGEKRGLHVPYKLAYRTKKHF